MKRLPLWCAIPAGVLAAHAAGYLLAYRNGQYRADILAATGHGYLGHATLVATIGAAIAVSLAVARGIREAQATKWWDAALRMAGIQTVAFFAVEILERVAAGVSPFVGFAHILAVGTIVQLCIAAVVAGVLLLLERAGRTIATALRSVLPQARAAQSFVLRRIDPTPRATFVVRRSARAPPLLLASN